jgi:hypothetical protein
MKNSIKKIVLAYSGGLDTSVIIKWLKEKYGGEIIAFAENLRYKLYWPLLLKLSPEPGPTPVLGLHQRQMRLSRNHISP